MIYCEGEIAKAVYLIKSGQVKLEKGISIEKPKTPYNPQFGVKNFYERLRPSKMKRHAALALLGTSEMFGEREIIHE